MHTTYRHHLGLAMTRGPPGERMGWGMNESDAFLVQMEHVLEQAETGCTGFVVNNGLTEINHYIEILVEEYESEDQATSLRATLAIYGLLVAVKHAAEQGRLKS